MSTSNKHTHKTGGAWVPINGGDWRSGSIRYGRAREQGLGVSTKARAAMFVKDGKNNETANQKEAQQNQPE